MVQVNRTQAIEKLKEIVDRGRSRTHSALREIQEEWEARRDLVVKPSALGFAVDGNGVRPTIQMPEGNLLELTPTGHAYRQILERTAMPAGYAKKLQELGEHDLLKANLETMFGRITPQGALVRHVEGNLKGFLTTAYKTMDAAPVFEGFAKEALNRGYVPYQGRNTDTRYQVAFLFPNVLEPTPGEFVVFGLSLTTGDYGGIAKTLELMAIRIWCDNLALGFDVFRKVHIGGRLQTEGDVVRLSKRTLELDTRTVVSMTRDAVADAFRYYKPLTNALEAAANRKPNVDGEIAKLGKAGIRKDVLDQTRKLYESELPVEAIPAGQSAWRLSNVLSLLAKSEQGDQAVELEKAAWDVLQADDLIKREAA